MGNRRLGILAALLVVTGCASPAGTPAATPPASAVTPSPSAVTPAPSSMPSPTHAQTATPTPAAARAYKGTFSPTGSMAVARGHPAVVRLLDGRVLVYGETGEGGPGQRAELYDPKTGSFVLTGSSGDECCGTNPVAVLLSDGRVLVMDWTDTKLYDPSTGKFSATGRPNHGYTSAIALLDGRVLVFGAHDASGVKSLPDAELYDPSTGAFNATGPLAAGSYASPAVLLADGRVLVANGINAELYDPQAGTFSLTGAPVSGIHVFGVARLVDGRVLFLDTGYLAGQRAGTGAELYDPASGTFTTTGAPIATSAYPVATLLTDGRVLVLNGDPDTFGDAELYDPKSGTFTLTSGQPDQARALPTAVLLDDGRVLVVGGYGGGSSGAVERMKTAELFQ